MTEFKGLYAIADAECIGKDFLIEKISEVLTAGVKILQYRDKINSVEEKALIAHKLRCITRTFGCKLIINDNITLANMVDADGVHLGKEDLSIDEARKLLGPNKIIGASCYNQFNKALQAQEQSASYVAFGSIYNSPTKPNAPTAKLSLISKARKELNIPICVIGGITIHNVLPALQAGADLIAVISALFNATDPSKTTAEFLNIIHKFDLTTLV